MGRKGTAAVAPRKPTSDGTPPPLDARDVSKYLFTSHERQEVARQGGA